MCVYGYKVNIYAGNTNSISSKREKVHWCGLVLVVKLLWKDFLFVICDLLALNANWPACDLSREEKGKDKHS